MFKIYSGIKEKPSVLNPSAYSLQAIYFLDSSMESFLAELISVNL